MVRWDGNPNALFYEVALRTEEGDAISVTRVTEPVLALNLGPGRYRYQIVLYNLLRKPELALPWQELEVLKAEMPRITSCAPGLWFLEESTHLLTVQGEDIRPEATFQLRGAAAPLPRIDGTEESREGTAKVSVSFPSNTLAAGEFTLEVTNPGGLSVSLPHAVRARHMLPAAAGLSPGTGSVFGPRELREAKSIRFSWDPVPEATRYSFCLYQEGETKPALRRESLKDCACILDLPLLDRGEFRWTVEAQGVSAEGISIPAVAIAEARFRIELPRLSIPSPKAGDTFYGR